jgi:hypothetical protein
MLFGNMVRTNIRVSNAIIANCSKKGMTPHGLNSTWVDVEAT